MKSAATILKNWSINSRIGSRRGSRIESHGGIDWVLFFTVLALVVFGLVMLYSASFIFAQERMGDGLGLIKKQMIFAVLGFGAMWATARLDYRKWSQWGYWVLGLALLLLALVLVPGVGARVGGAQRWLRLGFFNFQPGEFAKFAVLIFVARQLDLKSDRLHLYRVGILGPLLMSLPAMLLWLAQPDFGTTAMICLVILMMLYLAGVSQKQLGLTLMAVGAVGAWLILGTAYRRARLMTFLSPWDDPGGKGFQILQSLLGFYHGSLFGVGLGNGKEKLFYLPEAHNDFIFAVIGEELGWVGITAVVAAICYFIYRGLKISWKCYVDRSDRFGMLLGSGITLALGVQGLVNMAVALGLLPTKGLTLPFISYGGSALVVDLFAVGILLSISRGTYSKKRK